jgi:hypothetical protein
MHDGTCSLFGEQGTSIGFRSHAMLQLQDVPTLDLPATTTNDNAHAKRFSTIDFYHIQLL